MQKGKLIERKHLKQINLTEGFLTKVIKHMFSPMINRGLKKLVKDLYDDPELQSVLADYHASVERTADTLKGYCKKNPDSPLCDKSSVFYKKHKRFMK